MIRKFQKKIPYALNLNHPNLQEIHFTENENEKYSGPYQKEHLYDFLDRLINEGILKLEDFSIQTKKSSYYFQNKNILEIIKILLTLYNRDKSILDHTWYFFHEKDGPFLELGPYYYFFITSPEKIELECVSLELKEEIDFQLLKQPDYENETYNYDEEYDQAYAEYWYRKFYNETKTGQIESIKEEIRLKEEKPEELTNTLDYHSKLDEPIKQNALFKEKGKSIKLADTPDYHPKFLELISATNRKLSLIIFILFIILGFIFLKK